MPVIQNGNLDGRRTDVNAKRILHITHFSFHSFKHFVPIYYVIRHTMSLYDTDCQKAIVQFLEKNEDFGSHLLNFYDLPDFMNHAVYF